MEVWRLWRSLFSGKINVRSSHLDYPGIVFLTAAEFTKIKILENDIARNGSRTISPEENCLPNPNPKPNSNPKSNPKRRAIFLWSNCPHTVPKAGTVNTHFNSKLSLEFKVFPHCQVKQSSYISTLWKRWQANEIRYSSLKTVN